jgi:hypothetical protein
MRKELAMFLHRRESIVSTQRPVFGTMRWRRRESMKASIYGPENAHSSHCLGGHIGVSSIYGLLVVPQHSRSDEPYPSRDPRRMFLFPTTQSFTVYHPAALGALPPIHVSRNVTTTPGLGLQSSCFSVTCSECSSLASIYL